MKLSVIAVGRLKGAEGELVAEFRKRIPWQLEVTEVEERRHKGKDRIAAEGRKLLAAVSEGAYAVVLERTGKPASSEQLAVKLRNWMERGEREVCFVIGGAGGLSAEVLARADTRLSFGPMTWPHQLVRVMLFEQLYRAWAILSGHPYHK